MIVDASGSHEASGSSLEHLPTLPLLSRLQQNNNNNNLGYYYYYSAAEVEPLEHLPLYPYPYYYTYSLTLIPLPFPLPLYL